MAEPGWSLGEQDTVIDALARAVAAYPDKTVLDFSGETYSYAEIDLITTRFAHALAALGVSAGDTVVSMLDNNVQAIVTWLAVNKLCAVSVPLNTALRGGFLRHQISDAGANLAICEADYLERINAISGDLPDLKTVLVRGGDESTKKSGLSIMPLSDHSGEDETPIEIKPRPADLAALIYTSGTTGPSKGCMLSYNYMCNLARQQLNAAPTTHDDIMWTPLPLFHLNALSTGFISTILMGGTISYSPRFSVSGFWPAIEKSGATAISILGAMGNLLANADDNDAMLRCKGQIHTVRGNPFSEEMKNTWRTRFGAKQVGSNGYGLTEAAVVTTIAAGEYTAPGSSGKISPQFDVRIVDDEDVEVSVGQSGEIIIRPLQPNIMFQGYWKRPEATMKIMRNMWLHSGDIGRFDEDGFFYFVDRKKDYLRRRGENISSFELEQTFLEHPAIENVAIHAVPSEIIEDDVKLTAILKPGQSVDEKELCLWAAERVPYYAVPRYIEFREEFPTNPQGRVLKYQLREEGVTDSTWDMEKSDVKLTKR
ncbi:MAG: ATP-dependent acyl-CoA ligase [Acidimicrobiales bacterium]|nr:AMP-binding protein [Hyphomonadaceae bacterium]RZV43188.1 MAG: ATP-dependent acyl-CoA ligase [Acidimicrobiales bacterium]